MYKKRIVRCYEIISQETIKGGLTRLNDLNLIKIKKEKIKE
jgi:hypothetical protein